MPVMTLEEAKSAITKLEAAYKADREARLKNYRAAMKALRSHAKVMESLQPDDQESPKD